MTEVALEALAVPCTVDVPSGILILSIRAFEEIVREEAVAVAGPDGLVDGLAVNACGFGAGVCFEVVGDATGGDEAFFAKRTTDGGALVGTGMHVLPSMCLARMIFPRGGKEVIPFSVHWRSQTFAYMVCSSAPNDQQRPCAVPWPSHC